MSHHIFVFWRLVEMTTKCVNPKVFRQHAYERSFHNCRKRYQHTVTESLPIVGESYGRGSNFRRFSRSSNTTGTISFLSCGLWRQTVSYLCKLALCDSLNCNGSDIVSATAIKKCTLLRLLCLSMRQFVRASSDQFVKSTMTDRIFDCSSLLRKRLSSSLLTYRCFQTIKVSRKTKT